VKLGQPQMLWFLLAVPLAYALMAWDERRRRRRFARFVAEPLWGRVAPDAIWGARLRKARLLCAALALGILALARPQWGTHEETVKTTGLDVLVALDVSNSMEVEDVVPSRLKKARHLVKSLLDRIRGDRVGVVAFAGSSYMACPLTTDLGYVAEMVDILGPRMVANQGTDLGIALETARRALERGAEETGPPPSGEAPAAPSRVVLLISDGEDQEGGGLAAAKKLREAGIRLYAVGVGSQKGGPIPVRDESGNLVGYKKDRSGQPVVSAFRPDDLMKAAEAGGGKFWNASQGEEELDEFLREIGALNRTELAERRYVVHEERFQIPLALAVALLFWEISVPVRRIRGGAKERRKVPGISGAPGKAVSAALGAVLAGALAPAAAAAPPLDAYLENEKGLKAYGEGKVDEARQHFGSAQALDPSSPELEYNQGVVQLEQGDPESAAQSFSRAMRDPRLAGKSLYNLGNALAKKGDVKGAIQSYLGSIGAAQRLKDADLESDARKNLELLIQQQQQQKQQSQNDQDQKDPKQDQQKDQGQDDPKKQDNQAQNQPKRFRDDSKERRGKRFKSEKLKPEDAERVMAELQEKERELQAKLKKQNGNPQPNAKDW
jgi:Ca-activated chloride channel homolog